MGRGSNHQRQGRAIEFLFCYMMTAAGYRVTHMDQPGYDVLVNCDDSAKRVQVKNTAYTRKGLIRWTIRKSIFDGARQVKVPLTKSDCDLIALHWEETPGCFYMMRPTGNTMIELKPAHFRRSYMATLHDAFGIAGIKPPELVISEGTQMVLFN